MTSMRPNDVASTSFRRHVPTRFLTNQCQIITFLILKSDIIENSRIELRGIFLPLPSNQIKVIEDIYFFEVNTKYISSNVLKISVISRVRSTSEIADIFNT